MVHWTPLEGGTCVTDSITLCLGEWFAGNDECAEDPPDCPVPDPDRPWLDFATMQPIDYCPRKAPEEDLKTVECFNVVGYDEEASKHIINLPAASKCTITVYNAIGMQYEADLVDFVDDAASAFTAFSTFDLLGAAEAVFDVITGVLETLVKDNVNYITTMSDCIEATYDGAAWPGKYMNLGPEGSFTVELKNRSPR